MTSPRIAKIATGMMIQIHHKEDASSGAFPNLAIGQTTKI